MARKSCLGRTYGDLKVIEVLGNRRYRCQCVRCGHERILYSSYLKPTARCKVCGAKFHKDMRGQKYGLLTVVDYDKDGKWLCKCECGNIVSVKSNNLKHGNTRSCGKCKCGGKGFFNNPYLVEGTLVTDLTQGVRKNNTSGTTGVYYNKRKRKWYAAMMFQGQNYFFGYYSDKKDAIAARKEAEEKLHGPFLEWYAEHYPEQWEAKKKKLIDRLSSYN